MHTNKLMKEILEWLFCIIIATIIALFFRYYVGTPTVVENVSMSPTLSPNDRLILNRIYRTISQMPVRGEIITFEAPSASAENTDNPVAQYTEYQNVWDIFFYYVLETNKTSYIKRVIGLPGEHVKIENNQVYINGNKLAEPYLCNDVSTTISGSFCDIVVPDNCVFVMGDNRLHSTDSRAFGCIPINKIESKVLIRFFPFTKFGNV